MATRKKTPRISAISSAQDAPPPATKTPTKSSIVVELLQRAEGAMLMEVVEATGWQSHTARAMLTGLRKKGHAIERRKRNDITCYYLPAVSA